MEDPDAFAELRDFARKAGEEVLKVDLSIFERLTEDAEAELGRITLLAPNDRPANWQEFRKDVTLVRALKRYRIALEGLQHHA